MAHDSNTNDFPIAVIGASAGGLQAIQAFVAAIPNDSPIAYIIIQHTTARSQLAPILQKDSPLPLIVAADNAPIEAGKISTCICCQQCYGKGELWSREYSVHGPKRYRDHAEQHHIAGCAELLQQLSYIYRCKNCNCGRYQAK